MTDAQKKENVRKIIEKATTQADASGIDSLLDAIKGLAAPRKTSIGKCKACGQKNRWTERPGLLARCGKCGLPL